MNNIKKALRLLVLAAIYYHLLLILLFYSFVMRATFALGRFPQYNNPDPKELGFNIHYNLVVEAYEILPYSFIVVILYLAIQLITRKNMLKIDRLHFYLFLGCVIWIILLVFTELFGWFGD